jgi:hypothetical protein
MAKLHSPDADDRGEATYAMMIRAVRRAALRPASAETSAAGYAGMSNETL